MSTRTIIVAGLLTMIAVVAVIVSGYLAWASWQAADVAGCGGGESFGCDEVLTSHWSRWLGIPVAFFGCLVYAGIVATCWPAAGDPRSTSMAVLSGLTLAAVGSAVWFVGLQAAHLQTYCPYCLAVHSCGLVAGGLTVALLFVAGRGGENSSPADSTTSTGTFIPVMSANDPGGSEWMRFSVSVLLAGCALAALVGGQLIAPSEIAPALQEIDLDVVAHETAPPPPVVATESNATESQPDLPAEQDDEPVAEPLRVAALGRPLTRGEMPTLGPVDAPYVVVEMFDYSCHHCRELHTRLRAARERYGDQLAIVLYPIPLNRGCNSYLSPSQRSFEDSCEYARLAISVWEVAPDEFAEFHDWMMESRDPPLIQRARKRAMDVAGSQILLDTKRKNRVKKQLRQLCADWYVLRSGLPLLLFGDSATYGRGKSDQEIFDLLERELGVTATQGGTSQEP